jgi:hypothetical protein
MGKHLQLSIVPRLCIECCLSQYQYPQHPGPRTQDPSVKCNDSSCIIFVHGKNGLIFPETSNFDSLATLVVSSGPLGSKMRPLSWAFALAALAQGVQALELLKNEAMILYADVSPKLRVITKSSAFKGGVYEEPYPCAPRSLHSYICGRGVRIF